MRTSVARVGALLVTASFAAACASGTPNEIAPASSPPAPTASAASTASVPDDAPTSTPTTAPPTAAATPTASAAPVSAVEKVREYVRACKPKYSTYADAVVIVTVHNSGNGWAKLEAGDSDYTIYDKSGGITTTGSFLYAYPKYLAPGETGYLADTASVDGGKTADFVKVEADGRYTDVDENDAIVLETSKVKLRKESFGGGRIATGLVTNTSTTDVDQAHVGAFYLDAAGRAVGFSETNLIENLNAGKSKGFETVTTDCPPNFANVEKTVVLAGDDNF